MQLEAAINQMTGFLVLDRCCAPVRTAEKPTTTTTPSTAQ